MARQAYSFRRLHLTNFMVKVPRTAGSGALKKAIESEGLAAKWQNSPWAKKQVQREKRAAMTDFDRFKLMVAKKTRRTIVATELKKIKKTK